MLIAKKIIMMSNFHNGEKYFFVSLSQQIEQFIMLVLIKNQLSHISFVQYGIFSEFLIFPLSINLFW